MRLALRTNFLVFGMLICGSATMVSTQSRPRVFLLSSSDLRETKRLYSAGDKTVLAAAGSLLRDADKALKGGTFSVVTKGVTPPSGDKHDYMSQAPYFWPDPAKKDGLPYTRRDGERNPEINKISDHDSLDRMVNAVSNLSLAYYLKGDERYAAKAVEVLRAWFLDPGTRMKPNLDYAQGIPGINTGRGIGLIETRGLTRVVDSIGLLEGSKSLTDADRRGINDWFDQFLRWMQESKNGRDESNSKNNHGTYYDLQTATFALFLGKTSLAKNILETAKQKRIAFQIEPDGRQPLELERTKAWSYSIGNLDGLMQLATLGESVGVDLWNYQTNDGRSIRKAIDYLYPFTAGEKWTFKQLGEWQPQALVPLMKRAAEHYKDEKFRAMLTKVSGTDGITSAGLVFANRW